MKKWLATVLFLVLMISTAACGPSKSDKEFPYLPTYENMTFENFIESTEKGGLNRANFTVKNTKYKDFLADYEKILQQDGWEMVDDRKPFSINVKKEDHVAIIILTSKEGEEDIQGMIYSK